MSYSLDADADGPTRNKLLSPAEFAVFFNEVVAIATDPGVTDTAPVEVLRKHGIVVDLPPQISRKLTPLLQATKQSIAQLRATTPGEGPVGYSGCGACGACGVCAACAEINAGAPGAAAAAIWAILPEVQSE